MTSEAFETVCPSADRAVWLEERRGGIGGSEAATVIGLNPWRTPLELWAEKSGVAEPSDESEAAYWGTALEPLVLRRFQAATSRVVKPHGMLLRSIDRPWQLATLDGEQQDGDRGAGVVEIKCTGLKERWEDGIPDYVNAQVQHQLSVTGWQWASVAALFNGREFWWGDVARDDDFIGLLNAAEEEFWNRVLFSNPPEAQGSWNDRETLARMYPKQKPGVIVELGADFVPLTERLEQLKAEKKKLDEQLLAVQNTITQAIGEAETATLPNGVSYTYKAQSRNDYVVAAQSFRVLRRKK